MIINGISCSVYSIVAPYFPDEAHNKGLSSMLIGLIIAVYPIFSVLVSFFLSQHISSLGKKRIFLLGCAGEAFATFFYAFLPLCSYHYFIALSIFLRMLQGLGSGSMGTAMTAIIVSEFPDDIPKYMGFTQISVGLGFMAGPAGASGLYALGGYSTVFFTYGLLFLASIPLACWLLDQDKPLVTTKKDISLFTIIANPEEFLYVMILIGSTTSVCFIFPTLSLHLEKSNIPAEYFGIIFGIPPLSYIISTIIVVNLKISMRAHLVAGTISLVVSNLIVGPWGYVPLPHVFVVTAIGLVIMGYGACSCNIMAMPTILKLAQQRFSDRDKQRISDVVSGLTNSCYFISEIYAPPLSGLLNDLIGFDNSEALLGGCISLLLFPLIVVYLRDLRTSSEQLELQEQLKSRLE